MTDADWTVQALKDDLALNMFMYARGNVSDVDAKAVQKLAAHLGFDQSGLDSAQPPRPLIEQLLNSYAFAATKVILTKAKAFADQNGKKLMVVLFDPSRVMKPLVEGKARYDQAAVVSSRSTSSALSI